MTDDAPLLVELVAPAPSEAAAPPIGVVGGKGHALWQLSAAGVTVPFGRCITTAAYRRYLLENDLSETISFELGRKSFDDMRWEELWDAALRIRRRFVEGSPPSWLIELVAECLRKPMDTVPVAVRSSASAEDDAGTSFAGLHESYVNVSGVDEVVRCLRLVWASLWSDAALLYRRELQLDPRTSAMAVVVQATVAGTPSGVVFSVDPMNDGRSVIEAVHGMNQGLVDGTIEPDRWHCRRVDGAIENHHEPSRAAWMVPTATGLVIEDLPDDLRCRAPLDEGRVGEVFALGRKLEEGFGSPRDVEWTWQGEQLMVLQSRPVTVRSTAEENQESSSSDRLGKVAAGFIGDRRSWYLSLRPSFQVLQGLRDRIVDEVLPGMDADSQRFAGEDLSSLSDDKLLDAVQERSDTLERWTAAYWEFCIPFAHGSRLFGQFYNDHMKPDDPYEFTRLLANGALEARHRNEALSGLARYLKRHPRLREQIGSCDGRAVDGAAVDDQTFGEWQRLLAETTRRAADFSTELAALPADEAERNVARLVLRLADRYPDDDAAAASRERDEEYLRVAYTERFLNRFPESERQSAQALLELGRESWRLRDDDNIHLGRLEVQRTLAIGEALRRGLAVPGDGDPERAKAVRPSSSNEGSAFLLTARQLRGQPAGAGLASGRARVVRDRESLFSFQQDEVLVCDVVEPGMTFVVPLALAIVERRGGMLVHSAIIAREYGLPCVNGVAGATDHIATGDWVTVDGHLGIVVVSARQFGVGCSGEEGVP